MLGIGYLITIVTYLMDPNTYIRFGILHCISISMMLLPLFKPLKHWAAVFGLLLIQLGIFAHQTPVDHPWFLPLGMMPSSFTTLDYYPLLPWFGFVMIGLSIGETFYKNRKAQCCILHSLASVALAENAAFCIFAWPGKHALIIYLVHQPIILGLLWLITMSS